MNFFGMFLETSTTGGLVSNLPHPCPGIISRTLGHQNANQNPRCSSKVSFQTAYLKRRMNFDHRGFRFVFRQALRVSSSREQLYHPDKSPFWKQSFPDDSEIGFVRRDQEYEVQFFFLVSFCCHTVIAPITSGMHTGGVQ